MFLKRKPKNRRIERGNVLDVKLRTKEARAARLRLATTAVSLSLARSSAFTCSGAPGLGVGPVRVPERHLRHS